MGLARVRRHAVHGALAATTVVLALTTATPSRGTPDLTATDHPLHAAGIARTGDGELVAITGPAEVYPGTRVLADATPGSRRAAAGQRGWLAAGTVPGAAGPWAAMTTAALLDLHALTGTDGAAIAGASPGWDYVWPRDASFVAVALARTGHLGDATAALDRLAALQQPDGCFHARYLPEGGVPDDRGVQSDGAGWVLWAAGEVVRATPPADRAATAARLRPLVDAATAWVVAQVADGLPAPSPDYWEVRETTVTVGTVGPLLAGLSGAATVRAALGDDAGAVEAAAAADRLRAAVERAFGPSGYGRYPGVRRADAGVAFLLRPFQQQPLPGAEDAWRASVPTMLRPAGGLAPGAGWRDDGVSWTPETALYALAAAAAGDAEQAARWLNWLDADRPSSGALPEKVLADGSPSSVAPLAWTAAVVLLAVDALEQPRPTLSR